MFSGISTIGRGRSQIGHISYLKIRWPPFFWEHFYPSINNPQKFFKKNHFWRITRQETEIKTFLLKNVKKCHKIIYMKTYHTLKVL